MLGIQSTFPKSLDNFLNFFTGFKYALATMAAPPVPLPMQLLLLLLPLVLNLLWSNLFGGFFVFDWIISVLDRTIACFDLLLLLRWLPLRMALMVYAVSGDSDVERFNAGKLYWIWKHGAEGCDAGDERANACITYMYTHTCTHVKRDWKQMKKEKKRKNKMKWMIKLRCIDSIEIDFKIETRRTRSSQTEQK